MNLKKEKFIAPLAQVFRQQANDLMPVNFTGHSPAKLINTGDPAEHLRQTGTHGITSSTVLTPTNQ